VQPRDCDSYEVSNCKCWDIPVVGAGACQEYKLKITNTHTKRVRLRFMRFSKMPTSPGKKRDLLMIYTRYKMITIGSHKNTLKKSLTLKNGFKSIFIEKRRNPQNNYMLGPEFVLT